MSAPKRINDPEANSLPVEMQELARLVDAISGPEKRALSAAYERVAESILRRRRILNLVQEALSQLRLDVKYLMFDLETTRRERDQLQSQLEENDRGF
ncbi:MAG: transcriptional regulator [Planctomycetaceae bacterium]|nr:transcriptional regulator [Planctomycetaceae bacterium]